MDCSHSWRLLQTMEEIVIYDLEIDKQKACWFPFKKVYDRRRILPEDEEKPKVYVFEDQNDVLSKSFELSLRENNSTLGLQIEATQFVPETSHSVADLNSFPSEADETESTSTFSEEDDLFFGGREIARLADIDASCMSSQFWVDEIIDGRSLACADDIVGAGRSFTRLGHSFSTCKSRSTGDEISRNRSDQSDDFSLTRVSTPVIPARIEIEYDFSKKNPSFDMTRDPQPVQLGMCGALNGRDKSYGDAGARLAISSSSKSTYKHDDLDSKCAKSRKSHNLNSMSSSTSNSTISGTTRRPSLHSQCAHSVQNKSMGHPRNASFQKIKFEVVRPRLMEPVRNRLLCGATKLSRLRNDESSSRDDDIGLKLSRKTEDPLLGNQTKLPGPTAPSDEPIKRNQPNPEWMGRPSLNALWVSNTAKSLYTQGCSVPDLPWVEETSTDDLNEPHFYVEVEATAKQLKIVKDLDAIKAEEAIRPTKTTRVVEAARAASLVDDDSAFMERERMVDVLKMFAPKRSSIKIDSAINRPLKHETKLEKPKIATAFTPPRKTKAKTMSVSPSSKIHSESGFKMHDRNIPNRIARVPTSSLVAVSQPADSHYSNIYIQEPSSPLRNDGSSVWPSERPRSGSFETDLNHASKPTEIGSKPFESASRVWFREASRSYDPGQTKGFGDPRKISDDQSLHHPKRTTVNEYADRAADATAKLNIPPSFGQNASGDFTQDFEIARFPSLSTEDWKNASLQRINTDNASEGNKRKIRPDSAWSFQRPHQTLEPLLDRESKSTNIISSTRNGFHSSPETWSKAEELDDGLSLDESFEHAIPFVPESPDSKHNADIDEIDHRGMRRTKSRSKGSREQGQKSANSRPAKIWIDDDDSELNTEAFERLSMDTDDDDSIFSGLVDHSPSEYTRKSREMEGPEPIERTETEAMFDEDYVSPGNSIADGTKRSRYARYYRTDSSRVSTSLSVLSKDEITAYTTARSVLHEPFNCMDEWLD